MLNQNMNLVVDFGKVTKKPMRDGYGEAIVEIARTDKKVVALVADLLDSLKLESFKREFPDRLIEVGIQEQNMMGIAAGMAMSGMTPFVNSIACFNPGNNWNQIRVSVCLTKENVKIVGGHSGFGNGADGANQQSFEDIALTRVLPNMNIVVPADYEQVKKAVWAINEKQGPCYLRMTKPAREVFTTNETPFEFGKAQVLRGGKDISVFACGSMVYEALVAAEKLAGTIEVEVINIHTIKPIDVEAIVRSAKKTGKVVTAEEHSIIGGLGSAVAEVLSEKCPTEMVRLGMVDGFGESGEPEELMKKYGLTSENLVKVIKNLVFKK